MSTFRCSFFRVRKRSGCSPIGGSRGDAPRRTIPHSALKNPAFRRDFLTHSKMRFPFRNILKKYLRQENQRRFIFGLFLLRFFNILLRLFKSAYMYAVQGAVFSSDSSHILFDGFNAGFIFQICINLTLITKFTV